MKFGQDLDVEASIVSSGQVIDVFHQEKDDVGQLAIAHSPLFYLHIVTQTPISWYHSQSGA